MAGAAAVMQKTLSMGLCASKIGTGLVESPCTMVMSGDLAARAMAAGEEELRVRARILYLFASGESRRAEITPPPCLPVAPVMRTVLDVMPIELCTVDLLDVDLVDVGSALVNCDNGRDGMKRNRKRRRCEEGTKTLYFTVSNQIYIMAYLRSFVHMLPQRASRHA